MLYHTSQIAYNICPYFRTLFVVVCVCVCIIIVCIIIFIIISYVLSVIYRRILDYTT